MLEDALPKGDKEQIRILEVGLGYGVLATCASDYGSVTAIEHPSREYMYNRAYLDFFHKKRIQLIAADITSGFPFKDNTFNLVLFCDIWEHIDPQLLPGIMEEIKRILKPTGHLIISTPNLACLENRIKFLFGKSPNPPFPAPLYGKTYGHIREYTLSEITAFLKRLGFSITAAKIRILPVFEQTRPSRIPAQEVTKLLFPSFGDEIYLATEKTEVAPDFWTG